MTRRHTKQPARRPIPAPEPAAAASTELAPEHEGPLFALLQALIAVLLAARLLTPPEAAAEGSTLWLVELWFVAGVVWAWDAWRRYDERLRLDLCDLAVWMIVAGHVISALWTFHIGGDRRVALNLMWEWVALGLSFSLLRQVLRRSDDARRLLLATLCLAAVLAGLGIWQHYVGLPEARREYTAIISELDAIDRPAADISDAEILDRRNRRLQLVQQLSDMRVPPDAQGRRLFEDRLHSTEPFGLFALGNTFAAVLLAWLAVAAGLAVRTWNRAAVPGHQRRRAAVALAAAVLILLAYCLVLTKSRTAWVGLLVAVLGWIWLERRSRGKAVEGDRSSLNERPESDRPSGQRRLGRTALGAAALLIVAIVGVAALSGGLDRQVISEAPKSFRYRLQYWAGAAGVVREHPVLGVGPGNFRQHYLKYKLPASSEEIAEPHNFVLDLWTNGGLLAVCGALLLVVAGGRMLATARHPPHDAVAAPPPGTGRRWLGHPLVWGTGAAALAVLAGPVVLGAQVDQRLFWIGGAWLLLAALAGLAWASGAPVAAPALMAACLGVLVHLLGSGGIEMPAVPQTLLLLVAVGTALGKDAWDARWKIAPAVQIGLVSAMAVLCAVCWMTATGPVFQRESLLAQGDAFFSGDAATGRPPSLRQAAQMYAQAAESDPLSPRPLARLADLAFTRAVVSGDTIGTDFESAAAYTREAIAADPHSATLHRLLGRIYLTHFQQTQDSRAAGMAAEAMREAIRRYPSSAGLNAEAALAFEAAGDADSARRYAARALEIDKINHREGHVDKYLPEDLRMEVQRLARLE